MSWNPESLTDLTAEELQTSSFEDSALDLWQEFLAGWFSGTTHTLRGESKAFPSASLTFQDMPISQPMSGLHIQIAHVGFTQRAFRQDWSDGYWRNVTQGLINFYIRVLGKTPRSDGQNDIALARTTGDLLYSLLSGIVEVRPLNRKGIYAIRPAVPKIITDGVGISRLLSANARYLCKNEAVATA